MKRLFLLYILLFLFSSMLFSQSKNIRVNSDIQLVYLADGFYMSNTISNSPASGRYSSNGLLVIRNGKAFLIDSPVTIETTRDLIRFLADSLKVKVELFTGGHFHEDCIGGMAYLKEIGVKIFLNARTKEKCLKFNLPLPDTTYDETFFFNFEGIPVECRFPGGGHTIDNSIVYFPKQDIMFGGCLVKSNESTNLGNLKDADTDHWKSTMEKILQLYPSVKIIVPGHGSHGGKEMLTHTIKLVDDYMEKHE
jgi:metallo-beta-lactamase class B